MKKILLVMFVVIAMSCSRDNRDEDNAATGANSEENVDENSGTNISPQLQDSADRLNVDTVSSVGAGEKQEEPQDNSQKPQN